jgi:IPT/TIG domain
VTVIRSRGVDNRGRSGWRQMSFIACLPRLLAPLALVAGLLSFLIAGTASAAPLSGPAGGVIGENLTALSALAPEGSASPGVCEEEELNVAPVVTSVEPKNGPAAGGTSVTIKGEHFTIASHCALSPVKRVMFGSKEASFNYVHEGPRHEGELVATAPPGTGTVNVTVETHLKSAEVPVDQFTYIPPIPPPPTVSRVEPDHGLAAGGTSVTITGTNFGEATAVKFGSRSASFTVTSEDSITAVAPPWGSGDAVAEVTVTTPGGTSALSLGDSFVYEPTVTKVEPGSGPATGGTTVTITGAAFEGVYTNGSGERPPFVKSVRFGAANATSFKVESEGRISAVAPPGTGTVDVTVTTEGGTSSVSSADQFSYEPPTVHGEFSNWVLSGALHIGKLNQDIVLPEGSSFNGTASINLETQSGPLSGTITVPAFNAMVKILGFPAALGMEFTQAGSIEGSIAASTTIPGDFNLSLPVKANIGFSSITIFGLKIAAKCLTSEPLAFNLIDTLSLEELLSSGAQFMGATKFPTVKCEGTNGTLLSAILTSLFSGPSNPYSIMIAP